MDKPTPKVMVTGASGFIAQHVIGELYSDYEIVAVDKRPYKGVVLPSGAFINCDVRDLNIRDLADADYVIHLAFSTNIPNSMKHPEGTTYDNIDMTIHLMERCAEAGVKKFLFPSTASLYGHNPIPWKEGMPSDPIEPYSWQKLSLEYACKMYSSSRGLPTAVFRFFQVFGEGQRKDTALAKFIKFKQEGKPITLTETTAQSSFKSARRDFIYAGDIARAVKMVMESSDFVNGEIVNVGTGRLTSLEQVAEAIGGEVEWIPRRSYEVEEHLADITKLSSLGWTPMVDVLDWIKRQV